MLTVCTAVIFFVLVVIHLLKLDNKDTVITISTYAAVLVIFIRESLSGS